METPSLQTVLETIAKYDNGSIELNETIVHYQSLLRESKVLGELENGNVYVLKYSGDGELYVVRNYNTGTLTYMSTYDQYYEEHRNDDDEW